MNAAHDTIMLPVNPEVVTVGKRRMVVLANGEPPCFGTYVCYEASRTTARMVFEPDGMPGIHGRAPAENCYMLKPGEEEQIRAEYARQLAELKRIKEASHVNQTGQVSVAGGLDSGAGADAADAPPPSGPGDRHRDAA